MSILWSLKLVQLAWEMAILPMEERQKDYHSMEVDGLDGLARVSNNLLMFKDGGTDIYSIDLLRRGLKAL